MVQTLTSKTDFEAAIKSEKLVVVDFFATWCGPCKMIAPILEKLSEKHTGVSFYKVDVDAVPDVSHDQDITAMPTLKFFKDGKLIKTVVGANIQEIQRTIVENA
ncbi:thioredoxin family protein [Ascoidea rubescens DSM 1968]|uniref:Thioredoxin n=1 Tax=Ascoidea rubescens DSM 1968 TaxID=1344418 RepID=A0A1D2VPK0_9ASCO|nr:thioredoxin domain-containing protein [Ascoidea rubescens DSM 1968]ODV63541.1 thioredoxin domain-containing protein [Ascoidea rubescens DSM 1968]